MKKLICLLLALVMILALAGCRVSTRPYRRYATPYVTDNGTYNTTDTTDTGRTYRSNLRPRTVNPADAPLYDGTYRTAPRGMTGRTVVPSPAVPLPTTTVPGRTNGSFNVAS